MDLSDNDVPEPDHRAHRNDLGTEADSTDAHQISLELMKQLITLASGVVALSATFLEKFGARSIYLVLLGLSWVALVVSIFCGLQTISAIVKSRLNPEYQWSKGSGQNYARVSKYAFVIGISLFAAFAFISFVFTKR